MNFKIIRLGYFASLIIGWPLLIYFKPSGLNGLFKIGIIIYSTPAIVILIIGAFVAAFCLVCLVMILAESILLGKNKFKDYI